MDRVIALDELRDSAARAFPVEQPIARDEAWRRIGELGFVLVELGEADGGLGLGREAAAAIAFELGKALAPAPLIPALLGLRTVSMARNFARRDEWIERIVGGAYVPLNLLPGTLESSSDGTLSGRVGGLLEADLASHVVIGAGGGYRLIATDAPGVRFERLTMWDETRSVFDLHLDGYRPDAVLAEGPTAGVLHDDIARSAQLLMAADSLGGASAALAMSVDYLKVRRQFDRPLAMFQALKHRCADLEAHIAAAEALLWVRAANSEVATLVELGATKALAARVYCEVAEEAIQLHGGIGLTMEHPIHRFLKRAMLNAVLCGDGDHHFGAEGRRRVALAD